MSVCDRWGRQLEPDHWSPQPAEPGADVPDTVHADTGAPLVVVRFGDSTTVTTAEDMCASMGVDLSQFHDAMASLSSSGWLTLLEDGTYGATIPPVQR